MDNELKATFGSVVQAVGTTISAIESTSSIKINTELRQSLGLIGNALQATGNSLVADSEKTLTLDKIGNGVQAIGNLTNITGILLNFNEVTKQELNIKGNLLQAVGGGVSLADALKRSLPTMSYIAFTETSFKLSETRYRCYQV
jgi:hypothetical protein